MTAEREAGPSWSNRRLLIWGVVALALLLIVAVLVFTAWGSRGVDRPVALRDVDPASGDPPRVEIVQPGRGGRVPATDPTDVVVQALTGRKIQRFELWADGSLVLTQVPGEEGRPLSGRFPWSPGSPGEHVLVARAFADGRIGTSAPVVVEAVAGPYDGKTPLKVHVQLGNTVESIAAGLGATPDMVAVPSGNAELQPGEQVVVLYPEGQALPAGYESQAPQAQPTQEPQRQQSGNSVDGQPTDNAAPDLLPWGFNRLGASDPPRSPEALTVQSGAGCEVNLRWKDTSSSETGFRVYRSNAGGPFRSVRDLEASPENATLAYTDRVVMGGHYEYYVAALNAAAESPSGLVGVDVTNEQCSLTVPPASAEASLILQAEFTHLETTQPFDDTYCYLSLARLEPYSRLPASEDEYFVQTEQGWDISRWATGPNRLVFGQLPREPAKVEMECWARVGNEEPRSLGNFAASHPAEEWDGRQLTGAGDGFSVDYRIGRYRNTPRATFLVDSNIPRPYGVRQPSTRDQCRDHVGYENGNDLPDFPGEAPLMLWVCGDVPLDQLIMWEWAGNDAYPREAIASFRIQMLVNNGSDASLESGNWQNVADAGTVLQAFPVPMPAKCGDLTAYRVKAIVKNPIAGEEDLESLPSDPFEFDIAKEAGRCPPVTIEFTLVNVEVDAADDGVGSECLAFVCVPWPDDTFEAYGLGGFNIVRGNTAWDTGIRVKFWTEFCGERSGFGFSCVGFDPRSLGGGLYDLALESLSSCERYVDCSAFGPNHNTFEIEVRDGDAIEFWFNLRDDDEQVDDTWCGTDEDYSWDWEVDESAPIVIGPYSYAEWKSFLSIFTWRNNAGALSDQDSDCRVRLWIEVKH